MAFHTGATISPLQSFANQSKNNKEKTSSTAAVKRFAAKLRKIRWRIYQKIQHRKRRIKKTFNYYKNQVDKFLSQFSLKLKPKEVFIWTKKVAKTSTNILAFLSKTQHTNKATSTHDEEKQREQLQSSHSCPATTAPCGPNTTGLSATRSESISD